jgi:hypothetical protein
MTPAPLTSHTKNDTLAALHDEKFLLLAGDWNNARSLLEPLARSHCLTVGAFGGSITWGACLKEELTVSKSEIPKSKQDTWTAFFEADLNTHFPCHGKGHVVKNFGKRYIGSDYWINYLMDRSHYDDIAAVDVVIFETSINDFVGKRSSEIDVKQKAEMLATIVSKLPRHPTIAFLGASSRNPKPTFMTGATKTNTQGGVNRRSGDVIHLQSEVAENLGAACLSVVDAFGKIGVTENRVESI